MKLLFEFNGYKPYLRQVLGSGKRRSGHRSKLALFLSCQTAHVSQVLNGGTHFSVEQAYRINAFLSHGREESHFFFLLVNFDRAGSKDLQEYYQAQIDEIRRRRSVIKNRVDSTHTVPHEHQTRYYSSWHYLAIHMALSIPELQSRDQLAAYFHLPLSVIVEAVDFLLSIGLAELRDGRYVIGPSHIHLGHDTSDINKHHMNWRVQAMDSLIRVSPSDLHYSVVFSLSAKDAAKLKERLIATIKANLEDVNPSKEEVLFCSSIDFFEVKK
jgi:uncharacterized protein (TIGR02147 family)